MRPDDRWRARQRDRDSGRTSDDRNSTARRRVLYGRSVRRALGGADTVFDGVDAVSTLPTKLVIAGQSNAVAAFDLSAPPPGHAGYISFSDGKWEYEVVKVVKVEFGDIVVG